MKVNKVVNLLIEARDHYPLIDYGSNVGDKKLARFGKASSSPSLFFLHLFFHPLLVINYIPNSSNYEDSNQGADDWGAQTERLVRIQVQSWCRM